MIAFDYDALAGIAQLGLGLAGFRGIGLVLTSSAGRLQRVELYRLGVMLGTAMGAMFLSLLPIAVAQFGVRGETVCRVSAGIMAVYTAGYATFFWTAILHFRRTVPEILSPIAHRLVFFLHLVNMLVQGASAFGWLEHCVGWYWLGLFWLLAHATYQFGRILFIRPHTERSS